MFSSRFIKKKLPEFLIILFVIFFVYRAISFNFSYIDNKVTFKKDLKTKPTLFCMILTTPNGFDKFKVQTCINIWAHKCDNFKFISLTTDEIKKFQNQSKLNDISNFIMHPKELIEDKYSHLTKKVFTAIKQIYSEYGNYDWYLKTDDDTFIEMYNLRKFIEDKNPDRPVTYGYDFKVIVDKGYHSGGAGYLMSKEAFNRLGWTLHNQPDLCIKSGIEDVDVAKCLRKLNVFPNKSIDELGRERFIPLNLPGFYLGMVPGWLKSYSSNQFRNGTNCCSDSFISVHYMTPKKMTILASVIGRLTYLLNQNNTNGILIRPTFKTVVESFIKYEKIDKEMIKYWIKISKAMTTKKSKQLPKIKKIPKPIKNANKELKNKTVKKKE